MRKWLYNARKSKGYSTREVARRAGISQSFYCLIENDKRNVSASTAKQIARVLGTKWTNFFEDEVDI